MRYLSKDNLLVELGYVVIGSLHALGGYLKKQLGCLESTDICQKNLSGYMAIDSWHVLERYIER